ncbi:MAG: hypothetical protein HOP28_06360 [Gemmatimonadales bacterium]|nr:hypothetical protein [Gemmatimonadales bacterium]
MTRALRAALALSLLAGAVEAQSSQFGIRGLGIPLRPLSVRAKATGGGFGLFDAESAINPAAIAGARFVTASFQTVQSWSRSENPVGSANVQDNRYPGVVVSGPIGGTNLALAFSVNGYTDRNFVLGSTDTLVLRDVAVEVHDTLRSQGGISDLRVAVGWRRSNALGFGVGFHLITGSNRIDSRRAFSDSKYLGASEAFTYSYLGFGLSGGVTLRVGTALTLGGVVRFDEKLRVDRDTSRVGTTDLPTTVSGGARLQVGPRVLLSGSALFRNWSVADKDLIDQGGIGSVNITEFNAGAEILTDVRRPSRRPIRLGIHHATLPFPFQVGEKTSETGVSIGTGMRFVGDRAGVDLALQRIWRKGATGFSETATLLTVGVSLRP